MFSLIYRKLSAADVNVIMKLTACRGCLFFTSPPLWSHLGLNQGLPDYESGALTN